jgi:carbamoyl-phosphate synthase large subunit
MGKTLDDLPLHANDLRLWAVMSALRRGYSPEQLSRHTGIDPWFTWKFSNIIKMEKRLLEQPLTHDLMWEAKRMGFPDGVIGTLADQLPAQVRERRKAWNIKPVYKMVDTCAAEFEAATPYFYSSYEQENEAIPISHRKALVIGSGPIRIGQGIEFDYCSVHSAWSLREADVRSIMVNSNPETVSTDFDTSDRLYFEPLDEESIYDLLENEGSPISGQNNFPPPSIVQFGGQTAINLVESITRAGMEIIGSSAENIDITENRRRFEDFASKLGIAQPPGAAITSLEEALKVAQRLGFPVLVRPSYVLGGRAMEIVHNESELVRYMSLALEMDSRHPVLIDKYMQGVETEVDAVCDGEEVLIPGIMEHIERAGVHSGDALSVYPAQRLTKHEVDMMVEYTTKLGNALQTKGLMNVQFVIMKSTYGGPSQVYVIEVNPRASRTIPFISKVTGVPMVNLATKVMLGYKLKDLGFSGGLWKKQKLVGIKAPVFSMSKLIGVDTYLGPEMKSTGEVMGVDYTYEAALIKALIAAGLMIQPKSGLLLSIADRDKAEAVFLIRKLTEAGCRLYATEGTASMIKALGLSVHAITKKLNEGYPTVLDVIHNGEVQGVINTITGGRIPLKDGFHIRRAAAERRIPCFTSLDTARVAVDAMAISQQTYNILTMPEYLTKHNQP